MPNDIQPIGVIGIQGRDGSTSSLLIAENQCLEAFNIDWYKSGLGRKRGGATPLSLLTSGTAFDVGGVAALGRFVPAFDQTAAELWAIDFGLNFHRLAGGVTWASPTVLDACTATPQETVFLPFNGKLYAFYKNAHNRAHVWDGTTLRRVGLDLPAVPTVVIAAGAITDTRRYRVAWTKQVSGVTTYRSNLGPATADQVLAAKQATVSHAALPGEGETHWELYGASTSSAFGDYRLVGTATVATPSIVDNAALPSTVAPDDGENTPFPSARYAVGDDSRIIMGGAYEAATNAENAATPSVRRVWWSSPLGAGTGDDERVEITGTLNNYADLEEAITGISQPLQVVSAEATSLERGSFYVFSYDSQWKFIATGDDTNPYLKFRISGGGGCVHHKSILTAIDILGSPCIYWWSKDGPYRISTAGQEFLGQDIIDILEKVNYDATIPCHTVYHRHIHQVWFHVATGSSLYPDTRLVFDTQLGRVVEKVGVRLGWAVHQGESTKAYCSCMFSETVGATMGRKLKPYIAYTGASEVWKCDTTDTMDNGNKYQAYVDSKSYAPWGLSNKGGTSQEAMVVANAEPGVTVQLIIYTDEGAEAGPSKASLTDDSDAASATQVFAIFENSRLADSYTFRCRIGDAQPTDNTWNLQGLIVPVDPQ